VGVILVKGCKVQLRDQFEQEEHQIIFRECVSW
jgi:hypothetical protein